MGKKKIFSVTNLNTFAHISLLAIVIAAITTNSN